MIKKILVFRKIFDSIQKPSRWCVAWCAVYQSVRSSRQLLSETGAQMVQGFNLILGMIAGCFVFSGFVKGRILWYDLIPG